MRCDWCQRDRDGGPFYYSRLGRRRTLSLFFCDPCRGVVRWYEAHKAGYYWLAKIGERLRAIGGYL